MYGPPEYFENRRLQATNDDSRKNNTSARSFTLRTRAQMETNATMIAERTSEPAPATLPVQSNESVPDASTSTAPPVVAEEHVKANVTHSSEPVKQFSKRYQIREGVKDIDTEFAKDLAYRRPTVYRGVTEILVKNLSALTDLSVLQQKYGDHMLDISILQNGESKPPFHTEQIAVKDFLSKIFSDEEFGSQHYLQQRDLKKDLPGLVEDAGINPIGPHALSDLIPEEHCHFPTLYIGNKGIKTSLHYDRSCDAQSPDYQKNDPGKHNLFLQLSGSRRFTLFPMHLTEDLIPDEGSKWPHVSKSTTFLHTVFENCKEEDGIEKQVEYLQNSEYPSLARAWPEKIEIILTPGEALLIPARWWHYTEILEGGLALNWWFRVDEGLEAKISAKLAESGEDAPQKEGKKCIIS